MGLDALQRLIKKNPLEANRVITVVDGTPYTVTEAINLLQCSTCSEDLKQKILSALNSIGVDPPDIPDQWWELAYARYEQKPDNFVIFYRGRMWTKQDILREIANRTSIGEEFVLMELGYLQKLMQ